MSQLDHFIDIHKETVKDWPNIDVKSGHIRKLMWMLARRFSIRERKARLKWLRKMKTFDALVDYIMNQGRFK
jgi:hypothetical protein